MKKKYKLLLIMTAISFAGYIGSYTVLSSQGQYVPCVWGIGRVKHYIWAPRGFVSGPEGVTSHRGIQYAYLPLWWIDMKLVHTHDKAEGGKFPINKTLDDNLRKQLDELEQNKEMERAH